MRVGKRTWWTWVFHHDRDCCFAIRPSRGRDVVADFLGEHRPDIWVSDRFAAQMGWATRAHQVCLAHLIRDAQRAIEAGDAAFAPGLKKLLQRACGMGARRPDLADATLRSYASKLKARLDDLLRRAPTHALGEKLQRAIKACRQNLFVFLADRAVPPTNNGSEQGLRPCVTFRKVTNGFRSEWGAKLYADVRSVLETARRRAISDPRRHPSHPDRQRAPRRRRLSPCLTPLRRSQHPATKTREHCDKRFKHGGQDQQSLANGGNGIVRLKAALHPSGPPVWRRLLVPG